MHRIENPTEVDTVTAWMADGNCRNYPPAVFFPSDGVGVDRARKICTDCPVADALLGIRPRRADRARRVGWLQRARAPSHPQAPPRCQLITSLPQITLGAGVVDRLVGRCLVGCLVSADFWPSARPSLNSF